MEGKTAKRSANDGLVSLESNYPCKKFYRSRAHCNPLSHNDTFEYPLQPDEMDWTPYFPIDNKDISFVDVGCGFGGLTVALSELYPTKKTLGMEIRPKVCEFVKLRCEALRREHVGKYNNVSAYRTNCMRLLPHVFKKEQLGKFNIVIIIVVYYS